MLDKIDYSDIYKFKASVGLALIISSLLIPVFVLNLDPIKNYRNINPDLLSSISKESIQYQDQAINFIIQRWWILSIVIFLAGIILLISGLIKWKERQNIFDKMQELDLENKEKSIKIAPKDKIAQKVEEDAAEIDLENSDRTSFINDYKRMERKVIDSIILNKNYTKIQHNAKVGNFVYDLILIKRISYLSRIHKVCEIKYYRKNINYSYLNHGISNFLLAIKNYKKYFKIEVQRIEYRFYMIWIYTSSEQRKRLLLYRNRLEKLSKDKGENIKIIICNDENLSILKNELM